MHKVIQNKPTKSFIRANTARGGALMTGPALRPALLILGAAVISLLHINLAYAESDSGSLTITAEKSLTVTVPDTTNLSIHPAENGAFNTADINIIVNSNNRYGYNLNMTTATTSLTGNAPLSSGNYPVIESISSSGMTCTTETGATCNFTKDKWGYKLSTDTTYSPIQANTNMLIKNNTNESTGTPETSTVTFGARLSNATPAGSYSATLTFIATINNPTAVGGVSFEEAFDFADKQKYNGYYAMQDMDATICSYVRTSEQTDYSDTEEIQLIDKRDNKLYWVAKLLDNNCWMTQNLDLDLTIPSDNNYVALTSENTDIDPNTSVSAETGYSVINGKLTWIPATGTITSDSDLTAGDNEAIFEGAVASNTSPMSGSVGERYLLYREVPDNEEWSQNPGRVYNTLTECRDFATSNGQKCDEHNLIGNYYNFAAVTATNNVYTTLGKQASEVDPNGHDVMPNSICPKNWRLANAVKTDYAGLLQAYSINTTDPTVFDFNQIQKYPLNMLGFGYVNASKMHELGDRGFFRQASAINNDYSITLSFAKTYYTFIFTAGRDGMIEGIVSRCLLK
ncbi:hypothetical protein IJ117_02125 [Candidatus Saccharibacteria bacterium]|nr:hypothetical protein [Candidatus Saccharibacteria bacterium]